MGEAYLVQGFVDLTPKEYAVAWTVSETTVVGSKTVINTLTLQGSPSKVTILSLSDPVWGNSSYDLWIGKSASSPIGSGTEITLAQGGEYSMSYKNQTTIVMYIALSGSSLTWSCYLTGSYSPKPFSKTAANMTVTYYL